MASKGGKQKKPAAPKKSTAFGLAAQAAGLAALPGK